MANHHSQIFYIYLLLISLIPCIIHSKLIGVIQVIRHGARTPLDYYEDVIDKYSPFKAAELTNQGFSMAYEKGKTWKDYLTKQGLYSKLSPESIEVVSTPYERTIFTSMSYLKGMFPDYNIRYSGVNDKTLSSILKERENIFLKNTNSFINDGKKVARTKKVANFKKNENYKKNANFTKNTKNTNSTIFEEEDAVLLQLQNNMNKLNKSEINVEVIGQNKKYLYYHKCVKYNSHRIKYFKDNKLSEKDAKLILSLKSKYPKMFQQYCEKFHSDKIQEIKKKTGRVKIENLKNTQNKNSLQCPDEAYSTTKFIKAIASTLESINFHIEPVDPEILKLAYIQDFRYNFAKYNSYMSKQAATPLFKYFWNFLKNSDNCKTGKFRFAQPKNYKQEFELMESKFHCKKYALVSAHDDIIQNIIRNLFSVEKDKKEILEKSEKKSFKDLEAKLKFYWPTYVSDFTFELHDIEGKKFVKLFMNGKELNDRNWIVKRYSVKPEYTKNGIDLKSFLFYLENRIDSTTKYIVPCSVN
jgi:hypothetical protein